MKAYKKLSTVLGVTAAVSLALTSVPLLAGADAPTWQLALIVSVPQWLLFIVWRILAASERNQSLEQQTASECKQAVGAVYSVSLALLVAQALAVAKMVGVFAEQPSGQLFGIAVGLFVVILGNAMPKVAFSAKTLENRNLTAPAAYAANRFSGLVLMSAGAGMVLSWAILPHDTARVIAPVLLLAAVIASIARFHLARRASHISDDSIA